MPFAMTNCAQNIEIGAQSISILFWPSQHTLVILSNSDLDDNRFGDQIQHEKFNYDRG